MLSLSGDKAHTILGKDSGRAGEQNVHEINENSTRSSRDIIILILIMILGMHLIKGYQYF